MKPRRKPKAGQDGRKRDDDPVELRHLAMFYRSRGGSPHRGRTVSTTPSPAAPPAIAERPADDVQRRRRLRAAVLALAGVAFVIGAIAGASHSPSYAHALAERFTAAWARSDYASMYADIDAPPSAS